MENKISDILFQDRQKACRTCNVLYAIIFNKIKPGLAWREIYAQFHFLEINYSTNYLTCSVLKKSNK